MKLSQEERENIKEELLRLYREYCEHVDNDNDQVTYHADYKGNFALFMFWLETGDIFN